MAVLLGHPVNCCTSALKLVVLALSSVVGVLFEALDLLRIGLEPLTAFGLVGLGLDDEDVVVVTMVLASEINPSMAET